MTFVSMSISLKTSNILENKSQVFERSDCPITFFFNWDSLHARLNSHKKRSTKKITGYRKSVSKEHTVKRCLLVLDLKPLRS